jgi:hypothetical protein
MSTAGVSAMYGLGGGAAGAKARSAGFTVQHATAIMWHRRQALYWYGHPHCTVNEYTALACARRQLGAVRDCFPGEGVGHALMRSQLFDMCTSS